MKVREIGRDMEYIELRLDNKEEVIKWATKYYSIYFIDIAAIAPHPNIWWGKPKKRREFYLIIYKSSYYPRLEYAEIGDYLVRSFNKPVSSAESHTPHIIKKHVFENDYEIEKLLPEESDES